MRRRGARPPASSVSGPVLHLALHFAVPVLLAVVVYRPRWRGAALWMLAAMVVDVDHLLADPIYDPRRCSIGFHPLHRVSLIAAYGALFVGTWAWARRTGGWGSRDGLRRAHLVAAGLLVHMGLDGIDCVM